MTFNSHNQLDSIQTVGVDTDRPTDIGKVSDSGSGADTYIRKNVPSVPLSEKWLLTINEAAAYFGVGINRISSLALQDGCKLVLFVGSKKRIERKKSEQFLDEQYAI